MNIDLNDAILRLDEDKSLQLRDAQGGCVHVHWGDLWITQEGDTKDHIIKTGESFAISKPGTTYLAALSEAGVSVMEKCHEPRTETLPDPRSRASTIVSGKTVDNTSPIADELHTVDFQLKGFYPEADQVDRYMQEAARLRARYFADLMGRFWHAIRGFATSWRALG